MNKKMIIKPNNTINNNSINNNILNNNIINNNTINDNIIKRKNNLNIISPKIKPI